MKILLSYRRTEHTYQGVLSVFHGGGAEPVGRHSTFEDTSFSDMIVKLHKALAEFPDCMDVEFQRQELKNLPPFVLSSGDIELIRTDPVKAVKAMSPPPVRVNVGESLGKAQLGEPMKKTIRAGHDTLADAFGDAIYCSLKSSGEVECPMCGRWGRVSIAPNMLGQLNCHCGAAILGRAYVDKGAKRGWWGVDIQVLFQDTKGDRFYLPRAWNKTGPWISREDLQARYEEYLKEKERCSETQAATH